VVVIATFAQFMKPHGCRGVPFSPEPDGAGGLDVDHQEDAVGSSHGGQDPGWVGLVGSP
jgi:hypothetical protein